jgi:soluble lytic murein transglycosylase-like protein
MSRLEESAYASRPQAGPMPHTRPTPAAALAALILALSPMAAAAQVLEIGDDGQVSTISGPAVFTAEGARPIRVEAAPPSLAAAGDIPALIAGAAQRHGLSPHLLDAVAWQESRYRQSAVSSAGAVGVMQLTAAAARDVGADRFDLAGNVEGGAAYLSRMLYRFGGDVTLALAAYNAGPGAVERYGGTPPYAETQSYVASILARLAARSVGR